MLSDTGGLARRSLNQRRPIRLAAKMRKKCVWAPAKNFCAPIGATQGTASTFDFLCLFVAKNSSRLGSISGDSNTESRVEVTEECICLRDLLRTRCPLWRDRSAGFGCATACRETWARRPCHPPPVGKPTTARQAWHGRRARGFERPLKT